VKGWKKIYQTNGPPKQVVVAILILDNVDFKPTVDNEKKQDIPY
jgi:hypothetical protein